jgi:tetratricopeptide (TPR) repeat protein
MYEQAIDQLLEAAALNPNKKEIKLLVAECYFLQGEEQQALIYYERYMGEITVKNVKHAVRYGTILVKVGREVEGIVVLEATLQAIEGKEGLDGERV